MMVCRRWWRNKAVILALGVAGTWTAGARWAVAAAAPPAAPFTAADFEKAEAKDLLTMREEILKVKPMNPVLADSYGAAVAKDFSAAGLGLNSPRQEVRLNSAILIHGLKTLSTDRTLIEMLKSKDAAVRYWGARGLSDISDRMVQIGGHAVQAVVDALGAQAKVETSGVVQQELIKALIQYGTFVPLLDALNAISNQMETAIPDVPTLQTAALGLEFVGKSMGTALAPDKVKAAAVACRAASFAAQQLQKNEDSSKAIGATVAPEYVAAVQKVVEAATKVAGGASGKSYPAPGGTDTPEFLKNVLDLFGAPGNHKGKLQTDIPSVPVPPAVKD
jgi:hypothetical protein